VSRNWDTSSFLVFRILLGLRSFRLTVATAVAVTIAVAAASVSAFFAEGLDTRPEDRVAAVGGGSDSSGMVDGITKVGDGLGSLSSSEEEEEERGRRWRSRGGQVTRLQTEELGFA
jgi:hypothetical protein